MPKVFDNFIEQGDYTQKQIELSNKIKNILFSKSYLPLERSLKEIREDLVSDIHPLASFFERLKEEEQGMIVELIGLLGVLDRELAIIMKKK